MPESNPTPAADRGTVLCFDAVTSDPEPTTPALAGLSFRLSPGDAVRITVVDGPGSVRTLANLACGLEAPRTGAVHVLGCAWSTLAPDVANAQRARIGRVFAGTAWIGNLDIDENLLLAARHHGVASVGELRDRALRLARRFGLERIPQGRPAFLPAQDLQAAQWIRAWLCDPLLFVLEEPVPSEAQSLGPLFADAVSEACRNGAAALWLTSRTRADPWEDKTKAERWTIRNGRLERPGAAGGQNGGADS